MELFHSGTNAPIQEITVPGIEDGPAFSIKRLDLIHPVYGGNKYFKLKYHLQAYQKGNFDAILSFGGPFSNHLYALAGLAKDHHIPCYGLVRGFEHYRDNPSMTFCAEQGMKIHFLSPSEYNDPKLRNEFIASIQKNSRLHIIPEGGTDEMGVRGAEDMLDDTDLRFDYISVGVGTGGSISGMIRKSDGKSRILGFSALKGASGLEIGIGAYTKNCPKNWHLFHEYHFGGFARQTDETRRFQALFKEENGFDIDPVYQVKMLLGLRDLVKKDYFSKQDRILIMHTGGIQATKGYAYLAKMKGKS